MIFVMKPDSYKKTHTELLVLVTYCNQITKASLLRDDLENEKWKNIFKKLWLYYVETERDLYLAWSVRAVGLRICDFFTLPPEPSTLPLHGRHSVYLLNRWMNEYMNIKLSQMPLKPLSASNGIWLGKSSEEKELRSKLEEGI